jgi:mannose-1-phosphate guanylyltransferase
MAGGVGSRFWPLSRNERPKQFLDILGVGKTFIQQTYERMVKIVPKENILVVTGSIHKELVKEQLPELSDEQILLEPLRRNTAPCIAYATYKLLIKKPDAAVLVAPSDHLVLNEPEFVEVVNECLSYADETKGLVTIGIKPTRPETGYGYIQVNPKKPLADAPNAYKVKTFTEKPNAEMAKVFMDSGEFFWNSGLFIWTLQTIKQELENSLPEVASLFSAGKDVYYTPQEDEFIADAYAECRNISIDYGVMEKAKNVSVFCADFGWSDLGTWGSLYLHSQKDEAKNVVEAKNVLLKDVSSSMIKSTTNRLLVVKELDNFLVVDTKDTLFICPRGNDDEIKDFIGDTLLNKPDYA